MNIIEHGKEPERMVAPDAHGAQGDPQEQPREPSQAPVHTFPLVPVTGASTSAIYAMLRADIAALQAITDPAARQLPAAFMAVNMKASPTYHTGLRQLAPALEPELLIAALREGHLQRDEREQATQPLARGEFDDLDTRMAQSQLEELGWRERDDLDDVMRDLERLARSDWRQAAALWDKYRPDDPDKPVFIDGADRDRPAHDPVAPAPPEPQPAAPATPEGAGENEAEADLSAPPRDAAKDGQPAFVTPASLRKRYLIAENKFYFRDDDGRLAFEDTGKRLQTEHDDPAVARAMVELAAAKSWSAIKVSGSTGFRRVAWLAASLRGMDVHGYKATHLDKARLAELQHEQPPSAPGKSIEEGQERNRAASLKTSPESAAPGKAAPTEPGRGEALSPQQRLAVDTLATILRERGDSEQTIAMVRSMAADRFQHRRVFVGKLVAHGPAPYLHDGGKAMSYFVTLHTAAGERTIWGADLPRALVDSGTGPGDEIALDNCGKARVTVQAQQYGANGKPTGEVVINDVDRHSWQVTRLEHLRDEARAQLLAGERSEGTQPVVKVYDVKAPRADQRELAPVRTRDRHRPREPEVPR